MTRLDVLSAIGASGIHQVSEHTTVIEWKKGGARPATDTEIKLLGLLLGTDMSR